MTGMLIDLAIFYDPTPVTIGGGQIDDEIKRCTQADAYGYDAMAAVSIAKGWT